MNVLIYLLPDRLLYTINTIEQTKRAMIPQTGATTTGTKGEVDLNLDLELESSSIVLLLVTPKLNQIIYNYMNCIILLNSSTELCQAKYNSRYVIIFFVIPKAC